MRLTASRLLLPVLLVLLPACRTGYVLEQGTEFMDLMCRRTPVKEAINSDQLSPEQEQKLKMTEQVRTFAEQKAGLNAGDAYTTYVHLDREAVSWNITATPSLSTQPVTWSFPVVGTFPYLGYFEREDADELREQLTLDGYDVHMRPVNAFSTLGWFSDPIFSPMLENEPPLLINTIFHELVHRTIFLPDHTRLNEAIATELSRIATLSFLHEHHGSSSRIVDWTERYFQDLSRVQQFFLDLRNRLRGVYQRNRSRKWKRRRKKRMFTRARRSYVRLLDDMKTEGWSRLLAAEWNNAFIVSSAVYYEHTELIRRLWSDAFQRDLRDTVSFLETLEPDHPVQQIQAKIDQAGSAETSSPPASTASR